MKRYLNKREKQQVLITGFAMKMFTEMVTSLQLEGELKRKANLLATVSHNLFTGIIDSIDANEQKALIRAGRHNELIMVPKSRFQLEQEEHDNATDALFTIAEYALDAKCKTCHLRGHEVDACELRCSLIEFGLPYAREDVTEGCPFRLEAD